MLFCTAQLYGLMYALRLLCTKLSTSSAAKRFRPEWWSLSASGCWSLRYICRLPQFATDVLRPWRGSTTRLIPGSTEDLSKAALRHLWSHKGVTKVEVFLLQPHSFLLAVYSFRVLICQFFIAMAPIQECNTVP